MERWCGMITSNDKHMHWYSEMWSSKVLSLPHVRGATNGKQPSRCHDAVVSGPSFWMAWPRWQVLSQMITLRLGDAFAYSAAMGALENWEKAIVLLDDMHLETIWNHWVSALRLTRETSDSRIVVVVFRVSFCDLDSRQVYSLHPDIKIILTKTTIKILMITTYQDHPWVLEQGILIVYKQMLCVSALFSVHVRHLALLQEALYVGDEATLGLKTWLQAGIHQLSSTCKGASTWPAACHVVNRSNGVQT